MNIPCICTSNKWLTKSPPLARIPKWICSSANQNHGNHPVPKIDRHSANQIPKCLSSRSSQSFPRNTTPMGVACEVRQRVSQSKQSLDSMLSRAHGSLSLLANCNWLLYVRNHHVTACARLYSAYICPYTNHPSLI